MGNPDVWVLQATQQSDESCNYARPDHLRPQHNSSAPRILVTRFRDHYFYAHLTDFERSDAQSSSLAMVRVQSSARRRGTTPSSQRLTCRFPRLMVPVD